MKAAIVISAGQIEIQEIPDPQPGPYQALVKVLACGFCNGTDQKIVEGHWPGLSGFPYILGHETVSRVVSTGKKVRYLSPGDLVLQARVEDLPERGIGTAWGGFVEYALTTDWKAILEDGLPLPNPFFKMQELVPRSMDVCDAVMLITLKETYSALQSFQVPAGREVVICGDGPVGILLVACAKQLGAGQVILCGHHDDRLKLAREFGADDVYNIRQHSLVETLQGKFHRGIPLIVDAVGSNQIIQDGLDLLAPEGKVAVYGYSNNRTATIDWSRAPVQWSLEYLVVPVLERLLAAHQPLVEWMSGGWNPGRLVTHRVPLDQAQEAYELVRDRKAVKVIVEP